jgi:hypothetical protein
MCAEALSFKNPQRGKYERNTKMDLRKTIIIVSAACLVVMMVYLTFIKSKKPVKQPAGKPVATADASATAEADEANPDCPDYDKAIIKTAKTIRSSAAWENKGGPYVITGDFVIAKGATFTLNPGVVIKLRGKKTNLIVKGKLVSKGTKDKPVIITSFNDDSAGGDTNCDKGAKKPAVGDYGSVQIAGKKPVAGLEIRYAK